MSVVNPSVGSVSAGHEPPRTRRFAGTRVRTRVAGLSTRVIVLVVALVVAEVIAQRADSVFFPPVSEVWEWARRSWFNGPASQLFVSDRLIDVVAPSIRRLALAYVIAVTVAIAGGTAIGLSRRARETAYPLVHFLRAIPTAAKVPMLMVMFGIGDTMKIWVVALAVALPLMINVVDGVRSIDETLLDTSQVYRIGRWQRLWRVILPAASPRIFAGLRISTSVALVALVLAEMAGASNGLGFFILYAQRNFLIVQMWAGIFLLGALGFALNVLLTSVEHRALRWHRGARGRMTQ